MAAIFTRPLQSHQLYSVRVWFTGGGATSGSNLANLSGFPELIVPAGFSTEDLPIGLSLLGPAFSESRLLAIGYALEQATKARRLPVHTPLRPGDAFAVP